MRRFLLVFSFYLLVSAVAVGQMPGGKPVLVSHQTQMVNGKCYFIHVVEQGQTVYAISRAYGLKEVEAITKKDIHFLQVGDTVWLPCKGQRLTDGTVAPPATGSNRSVMPQPTSTAPPAGITPSTSNSTTEEAPIGEPATIRSRVNPQSFVVSLMMPLNLSQMDKISTTKFDVEQRGKINYKSLEFIQFYEGLLLGLDQLERMGYNVVLNVVDVEDISDEGVERVFRNHNVAQSDLLIAMLTRQPFQKVATLAREAQLFVVNPVADRPEIVEGNPYVFKCQPSRQTQAAKIVQAIRRELPGSPVFIVHSGAKGEKATLQALTAELDKQADMHYTLIDWNAAAKLTTQLKNSAQTAAIISVYDQDKAKNRIHVSQLLNRLSGMKTRTPWLFTFDDWASLYADVDFAQLQSVHYHTFYSDWHRDTPQQQEFIDLFRDNYRTEPTNTYAATAHDIILYFVCGMQLKGDEFFRSPAIKAPQHMVFPLTFSHSRNDYGFENQQAVLYRMTDFRFMPVE